MRVLVSGGTVTVERYAATRHARRLGVLLTPAAGNSAEFPVRLGLPWALDNSAFSGFDPARFLAKVARVAGTPGCQWVVCPDVVCDPVATNRLFRIWEPVIREYRLPVAYVGQDGCERGEIPWEKFDAFFVGGGDAWKDGPALGLVREAKRRGKLAHVGRVNTRARLGPVWAAGADTFDGTGVSQWPDVNLPRVFRWLGRLENRDRTPSLF